MAHRPAGRADRRTGRGGLICHADASSTTRSCLPDRIRSERPLPRGWRRSGHVYPDPLEQQQGRGPVPAAVAVALRAVVPNATVLLGGERRFRRTARPPRRGPPRVAGHLRRRASAMPMGNATCSEKHGARANSARWTAVRHRVRRLSAKPSGHDTHVVVRYWSSLRSGPYDDLVHVDVGGLLDGEGDGAGDRIG